MSEEEMVPADVRGARTGASRVAFADRFRPHACFAAGRLHLLLGEDLDALNCYARGLAHVLSGDSRCPWAIPDNEEEWIRMVVEPDRPHGGFDWARRLFALARRARCSGVHSPDTLIQAPVLIVAGGAASMGKADVPKLTRMLERGFAGLRGTVISGGTECGVPGCVGAAAEALGGHRAFKLIGFRPALLPDGTSQDKRYDLFVEAGDGRFTAEQVIRCWEVILDAGIAPDEVRLLGYGGGSIAAFEYRLALALGARTGVVEGSGGTADSLLADGDWTTLPNLLALPESPDTLRAFVQPANLLPLDMPGETNTTNCRKEYPA